MKNVNWRECAVCIAITQVDKNNTHVGNIVLIGNPSFHKIRSPNCKDGQYINSMCISLRNNTLKTRTDMHLVSPVNTKLYVITFITHMDIFALAPPITLNSDLCNDRQDSNIIIPISHTLSLMHWYLLTYLLHGAESFLRS